MASAPPPPEESKCCKCFLGGRGGAADPPPHQAMTNQPTVLRWVSQAGLAHTPVPNHAAVSYGGSHGKCELSVYYYVTGRTAQEISN